MRTSDYIRHFHEYFPEMEGVLPWEFISDLPNRLLSMIKELDSEFIIEENVAIHRTAVIEKHVMLKGPIIISAECFVGAHAYLRGGVFLGRKVSIGPGCEVKTCVVLNDTALAHFNFAGDSIIGSGVNMEAGSVLANYHNDRDDKRIFVNKQGNRILTNATKFGSLIGDGARLGANSVCAPGTILEPNEIVRRLQLIDQDVF